MGIDGEGLNCGSNYRSGREEGSGGQNLMMREKMKKVKIRF